MPHSKWLSLPIAAVLTALGVYTARRMPVDVFPDLTAPTVTVSSNTTGPRTPRVGLLCTCAMVAGPRSPSNVPVTASLVPVRSAEAEPDPATVACIAMSMGTGDNRAL